MSGRGRGISNAPAWMSRGDYRGGGGDRPRSPSPDREAYGRMRGGPPPRGGPGPPRGYDNRRGPPGPPRGYDHRRGPPPRRGGGGPRGGPRGGDKSGITFHSYEEERAWVEDRRRKRKARKSKFDVLPTPEQMAVDAAAAAMTNFAATDFSGVSFNMGGAAQPQQTRHARRLYIGHLPPDVNEQQLHDFFMQAIETALVQKMEEDPILSVYINHERRFCFLEFKTVEMTTACLALDGIDVMGRGKVKVKRPNDYNPAMAPAVAASGLPPLDVSRLGIISGTVQDGPSKIFIGGLHYHLSEDQVLELLQAFGQVRAFHLVKDDPDSMNSKGYCFVEYIDPNVTPVAVMGLNGMDLGGGKTLTARIAATRQGIPAAALSGMNPVVSAVPADSIAGRTIVNGYDVEKLVDAAMGLMEMPPAPSPDGIGPLGPITQIVPPTAMVAPAATTMQQQQPQAPIMAAAPMMVAPPAATSVNSALDIANAALAAAYGPTTTPSQLAPPPTRILVLLNMVTDQDLATDDEYNALSEEVREECSKFGRLLSMKIPRVGDGYEPTAVRKVFLEYATTEDAKAAESELAGRTFGPNIVQASFFDEAEYQAGKLK